MAVLLQRETAIVLTSTDFISAHVMSSGHRESALSPLPMAAVVFAAFVVALGYGTILPLLPTMIGRLLATSDEDQIAQHTALLSGAFAFAPVLAARPWGSLSDRVGRRPVLTVGLIGFALTFVATAAPPSLSILYLERFLNGAFAAAVVPSVLAFVTDLEADDGRRARAFGWVAAATSIGLLAGPILGGFTADGDATPLLSYAGFALVSGLAAVAVLTVIRLLPGGAPPMGRDTIIASNADRSAQFRLVGLSAVAAGGLGAFEVGLTIRSHTLSIEASTLGAMFAGCMVIMLLAQAIVFSPMVKPSATRWFIAPAFLILGLGLTLVALSDAESGLIAGTVGVAAAGGVLAPILAFWLSRGTHGHSGAKLGFQSAALNLGQTAGSAGGGLLIGAGIASGASLGAVAALAAAVGFAVATRLGYQEQPARERATGQQPAAIRPSAERPD